MKTTCTDQGPCVRHCALGLRDHDGLDDGSPCGLITTEDLGTLRYVACEAIGSKDPGAYTKGAAVAVIALAAQPNETMRTVSVLRDRLVSVREALRRPYWMAAEQDNIPLAEGLDAALEALAGLRSTT